MTRRAAKVTASEVERLIKAVKAAGLPIARVTFDGDRVDVVVQSNDNPAPVGPRPERFETLEEWEAWNAGRDPCQGTS